MIKIHILETIALFLLGLLSITYLIIMAAVVAAIIASIIETIKEVKQND